MRLWTCGRDRGVRVFAGNLHDLLLAAPAGPAPPWGSIPAFAPASRSPWSTRPARWSIPRPSIRTSRSGTGTRRWRTSAGSRGNMVELIAIGNGTASRETDKLAADLVSGLPTSSSPSHGVGGRRLGLFGFGLSPRRNSRSSTCRCAARCRSRGGCRIRSPNWSRSIRSRSASASTSTMSARSSSRSLDAVVEDCVNAVGVDLNTASAPLLARVSGLGRAAGHRGASRRQRPVPARNAEGRAAARPQGVRAMRGLPAHPEWRRSARRVRRASGSLSGGAPDLAPPRATSRR